jgi:DHA3 family tetracycline resistance protein-like MFS transporter
MSLFRALRHRPFALLWSGQTLSRLGDFVYEIALAWWVLEKTGSAATMSLVLIFAITPSVIFSLIGGVAVDRMSRLGLMVGSDILRGGVIATVSALAFADRLEVWQVFVASLIFGFVDAFFQPAYAALVPQIVPEADLPSANSLTSLSLNLGRIAGPAVGAAIVAGFGTAAAFGLNGFSFLLSTACLAPLWVTIPSRPTRQGPASSPLRDLREGFATVLAAPWLSVSILMFALGNITLAGPYSVAMPFLVSDSLHAEVGTLGLLYATFPLGYVIGGVWLGRYAKLRRRGKMIYRSTALAALMLGAFGFLPPLPVLLIAALINGFALEAGHLAWTNVLQERVPNEQLGRVVSIDAMGSFGLLPVGLALAGWATEMLGAPVVFIIGGMATAGIALLALAHPAIRELD